VSEQAGADGDARTALLALYDRAVPQVYGYLLSRCGDKTVAEDLTAETLLAAVDAVGRDDAHAVSIGWLIGVARHKLVDHWRRQAREDRGLSAVAAEDGPDVDPWEVRLDAMRARATLDALAGHHRAALTLRYVDDLPVSVVAGLLDRTVHATEALLVRARAAFRRAYTEQGDCDA
jgi:RNA polymerase sigma-70 factor (ECF subfamily)